MGEEGGSQSSNNRTSPDSWHLYVHVIDEESKAQSLSKPAELVRESEVDSYAWF